MEVTSLNNAKSSLPPMPISPVAGSEPPPPQKEATNGITHRPFKRVNDMNLETYKAKWHVSITAPNPFDNMFRLLKFAEKDRLGYLGPNTPPEAQIQASEMQNTGMLCVDNHVDHRR
jgi:hypothetical protein